MNRGITAELLKKNAAEKKRRTRWMREEKGNISGLYYAVSGKEGFWKIVEGTTSRVTIRRDSDNKYHTCKPADLKLILCFIPLGNTRRRRQ